MVFKISLTVPCSEHYEASSFELIPTELHFDISFHEGTHLYTSPVFKLGHVHLSAGLPLLGRLSFRYTYKSQNKIIEICGTDYPSSDGMTLATMPEGLDDEVCIEHACQGGFLADEGYHNRFWNYRTQLTPDAEVIFKNISRNANDTLHEALVKEGSHNILARNLLPKLSDDVYNNLCQVYQDDKFLEVYDPNHKYRGNVFITLPESSLGGRITVASGSKFANVLGSTGDPYPEGYHSWLEVWTREYGEFDDCSSDGYPQGFVCNNPIYGGHCILGASAATVRPGVNDVVFIIPICNRHNNVSYVSAMEPMTNGSGMYLRNYKQ